ncbi:MAG TPA: hypothetical protein VHF89_10005 [Solirubrobacteraceae bacterium]|nr:hypothetical protein [Solirubrobacteraceae bacterium]
MLATLTAALALASATAAAAQDAPIEYVEETTGALTITWRGDPARGCAEAGLCDRSGSVVLRGGGSSSGGSSGGVHSVDVGLRPGTARVVRGAPEAPDGVCTDVVGAPYLSLVAERTSGGRVALTPQPFGRPFGLATVAGRCAGPLGPALEAALPSAVVDRASLLRGTARIDLSGRRPFADGPFSGEVASTLVVTRRTRPAPRLGGEARPGRVTDARGVRVPRRLAILELGYRVERLDGALTTDFAGLPEPFCLALDACGLTGTHELRLRLGAPRGGTVWLNAYGPARALRGRRTVAGALAAVAAGALRLDGLALERLEGTSTAATQQPGAAPCRSSRDVRLPAVRLDVRRAALRLRLGGSEAFREDDDPLRTHCPGPDADDLAGGTLAAGRIPLAALARRRVTLPLAPQRGGAAAGDFAAAARGRVEIVLRRVRARVSVARSG